MSRSDPGSCDPGSCHEGRAAASFEGDLSNLKLQELPGVTTQETETLRRQTIEPELDFVIVPINQETVRELKRRLSQPGVLGRDGAVIHTQLAVGDELVLVACDNFHDECTVASMAVPEPFLKEMQNHGLLRAYTDADAEPLAQAAGAGSAQTLGANE